MLDHLLMKRRAAGFTLLELMLAVAIAVMLLLVAIPSVSGIFSEDALRKTFDEFDAIAQEAQARAVKEQRTMLLVWTDNGIALVPEVPDAEDIDAGPPELPLSDEVELVLERPFALVKEPPMEWTFWPSGTCEPVLVHYAGELGEWTAEYEPLTGRGTLISSRSK